MPAVNPKILVWARETAGLTLEEAGPKLNIQRLASYESGEATPSRSLILRMSQLYRRPLLAFYLPEPPPIADRGADFRTLPEKYSNNELALVDALIRNITARQSMVRAVLEEEEEAEPLRLIGSQDMKRGQDIAVQAISKLLSLRIDDFYRAPSPEEAFKLLRDRIESLHVFVLLAGNLGSHHTAISVEAFRGFAIADEVAPFIVVNDQDSKSAWSFTLLHEFAHLLLGQTGVSGARSDLAIEQFCNDVASEILLPSQELQRLKLGDGSDTAAAAEKIQLFARPRNLSGSMVAYRLYRAGKLSAAQWEKVRDLFRDHWLKSKALAKERAKDDEGGPTYYVIRRHRLGNGLLSLVTRMIATGALSTTRAATILGMRPANVHPLVSGGSRFNEQAV